jgi:hypothetical protein
VKGELRKTFSEHNYLRESSRLNEYYNTDKFKHLDQPDVEEGLSVLSSSLQVHWRKKTIILIDEYDAAINYAAIRNTSGEDLEKIIDLFRSINYSTFKSNDNLRKGLLTGVFRIAKASLFSGLNNLIERNITDSKYSLHYGFTKADVDNLLQNYEVNKNLAKKIKGWYNGYVVNKVEIYNPWSIVNLF